MEVKTVVIINDFNYTQGGASKVSIDTAKLLLQKGLKVYFFSAVNKPEENIKGIEYITTNQKEALKEKNKILGCINGIYNIKAKKELKKLLMTLDNKTTIVHIHGWTKALSSSIFKISNDLNFKIVVTVHEYFMHCPNGGFFNYKENRICNLNPLSLKCIKCNCDSRNYLIKLYRIFRQKIQNKIIKKIKANAIYVSDFSKDILKNSLIKNWNSIVINNPAGYEKEERNLEKKNILVYLGRLSKEKGVDLFCESVTKLNGNGIIIGDGPLRKELEEKYKNLKFVGWKSKEEIKNILKESKALVFTSLWYETMGMTAIEALSLGVPVVVGDKSATSSYITDNINGLKYENGNVDNLYEKLKILEDNKLGQEMSKNAYNLYWKNPFSEQRYIKELLEFYKKL